MISKVSIKDFRGIMSRFSELFGGFLGTRISHWKARNLGFRDVHRII